MRLMLVDHGEEFLPGTSGDGNARTEHQGTGHGQWRPRILLPRRVSSGSERKNDFDSRSEHVYGPADICCLPSQDAIPLALNFENDRRLPIFLQERTSSRPVGMSEKCRQQASRLGLPSASTSKFLGI